MSGIAACRHAISGRYGGGGDFAALAHVAYEFPDDLIKSIKRKIKNKESMIYVILNLADCYEQAHLENNLIIVSMPIVKQL